MNPHFCDSQTERQEEKEQMSNQAAVFEVSLCLHLKRIPTYSSSWFLSFLSSPFQRRAADQNKVVPKVRPTITQEKGGWVHNGNSGDVSFCLSLSCHLTKTCLHKLQVVVTQAMMARQVSNPFGIVRDQVSDNFPRLNSSSRSLMDLRRLCIRRACFRPRGV